MHDNSVIEEYWYVYVMLHPSRNLKVEISRENRKSNLLLNYKVILIKKYKYLNKEKAFQKKNYIENLSWEERENLIMDALIKKTKPLIVEKISNNSFVIICPECKYRNQLNCQDNELENKTYGFKCMHEISKRKN